MAWLEKRGNCFHLDFRFGTERFKRSLKTADEQEATEMASRVERRLRLIEQGDLTIPETADLVTFLLSDGKLKKRATISKVLRLSELFRKYLKSISNGSIEDNTLYTINIHLNHFLEIVGRKFAVRSLTLADLQQYVDTRSKQKGRRGKQLSPVTIKKELVSLSLDNSQPRNSRPRKKGFMRNFWSGSVF